MEKRGAHQDRELAEERADRLVVNRKKGINASSGPSDEPYIKGRNDDNSEAVSKEEGKKLVGAVSKPSHIATGPN